MLSIFNQWNTGESPGGNAYAAGSDAGDKLMGRFVAPTVEECCHFGFGTFSEGVKLHSRPNNKVLRILM